MGRLHIFFKKLKPIHYTILFEIKLNIRKFYIFTGFTILLLILTSYVPLALGTQQLHFPSSFLLVSALDFFLLILVFASSLFFSGIICSDYKKKTGLNMFPLIKKYQLFIGKYIGCLILVIGIVSVQYASMALLVYYFYGGPLPTTIILSYGFAILYVLALTSLISFISSFNSSEIPVIIIVNGLILIGFSIIDPMIMSSFKVEPYYSFLYLYNLIPFILYHDFSTMRRYQEGWWFFPTIEGNILALSLYTCVFLILTLILFRRREI